MATTFQSARSEALQLSGEPRVTRGHVFERLGVKFMAEGDPDLGTACAELGRKLTGKESVYEWESYAPGDPVGSRIIDAPAPAPAPVPAPAPAFPSIKETCECLSLVCGTPGCTLTGAEKSAVLGAVMDAQPKMVVATAPAPTPAPTLAASDIAAIAAATISALTIK
jgi:hypothetical protein